MIIINVECCYYFSDNAQFFVVVKDVFFVKWPIVIDINY